MSIATAFKRLHYPVDVIAQCVRWYLAYSLSLRNLEEMMAEREPYRVCRRVNILRDYSDDKIKIYP